VIVIELIGIFLAGVFMGGVSVMDQYEHKLDKCDTVRQDLYIALDECQGDLKLCELRQCSENSTDANP